MQIANRSAVESVMFSRYICFYLACHAGADLVGGCRGCATSPPPPLLDDLRVSNHKTDILQNKKQTKKKTTWFIGVEVVGHPS